MVMATPFLVSLRKSLDSEMWGVGKPSAIHLYRGLDLFDRFLPYDGSNGIVFLDLISEIRRVGFQRGIVLPHSFRSAFLLYLGYVGQRIGYGRNGRGFMLTSVVNEGREGLLPTVEHYLRLLDFLPAPRHIDTPLLRVTEDEDYRFDSRFQDLETPFIAFIAGAQYGPSKCWPDTHFSALADLLIDRFHLPILILPGKGEEEIARKIRDGARKKDRILIKDLDIQELKVCLSRAAVVVSNDTGPRHIATALSVPTIVILGPMDDRYTIYPSTYMHCLSKELSCRPCNKKRCDRGHECLNGITPEQVFQKVEEVLFLKEEVSSGPRV
jgi:heptosyltransferase II